MIANWKPATELPKRRIRVLTCDSLGLMRTGFYGRQSNIISDAPEAWRSDQISSHELPPGHEPEIDILYWDYFPDSPISERPLFG
jgi:hypothetical protein